MELWAIISVGAAFVQNLRSALQKTLAGRMSVLGATFARFLFAAPLALALVGFLAATGTRLPGVTPAFLGWGLLGALMQIAGTLMLVHLFSLRNFAVGNTFAKTETVQSALLGAVLLGDRVSLLGYAAILVSLSGLVLISARSGWRGGLVNRASVIGLACSAAFAIAAIGYRGAALSLTGEGGFLIRAAFTLAVVTVSQTLVMAAYMALRAPGDIAAVLASWRVAGMVGAAGMLASLGWFSALTLQTAALVKAVGQVELVFSYLTAQLWFRERATTRETIGIALVAGGILLLLLGQVLGPGS